MEEKKLTDYDIKDFVADIDVTKATKMAVIVFNDDDTTECRYYNMNLKDEAQAKHELENGKFKDQSALQKAYESLEKRVYEKKSAFA